MGKHDEYKSGHRDGAGFKKSSGGDPYVSGYRNGGEGNSGGQGGQGGGKDENDDGCMVAAAPVVVGIGLVAVALKFALTGRKR